MNNKRYQITIDIINIILRFMLAYTIIGVIILNATSNSTSVFKALCLFPAPIISYVIGNRAKHIWSYTALHLFMLIAYFFTTGSLFISIVYSMYLTILTVATFFRKLKLKKVQNANTSLILILVFLIINYYSEYLELSDINTFYFLLAIAYILLYLTNKYLLNTEKFFQYSPEMNNLPIHQIRKSDNKLILVFCTFCVFVMIIFIKLPINDVLKYIGSLLLYLLRRFLALFNYHMWDFAPKDTPNYKMQDFSMIKSSKPSDLWELIQKYAHHLMIIIIIVMIIALLVYGLYKVYHLFYEKRSNSFRDKTEFISPFDKKEKLRKEPLRTYAMSFHKLFGISNNERIRKRFYKAVNKHVNVSNQIPANLTPYQLSKYAITGKNQLLADSTKVEIRKQLTTYYEKARYSNKECSKEDLQSVKNILNS